MNDVVVRTRELTRTPGTPRSFVLIPCFFSPQTPQLLSQTGGVILTVKLPELDGLRYTVMIASIREIDVWRTFMAHQEEPNFIYPRSIELTLCDCRFGFEHITSWETPNRTSAHRRSRSANRAIHLLDSSRLNRYHKGYKR